MKWIFCFSLLFFLSCKKESCGNGTLNSPECNQCPPGKIFIDGQCAIQVVPEKGGK